MILELYLKLLNISITPSAPLIIQWFLYFVMLHDYVCFGISFQFHNISKCMSHFRASGLVLKSCGECLFALKKCIFCSGVHRKWWFMMTSSNGNTFRVTGPLCGEFTGPRSPVNSPHKGKWRGALMFSLICVWINGWVNNREAGDLRHNRAHYYVTVMVNFLALQTRHYSFGCDFIVNERCLIYITH